MSVHALPIEEICRDASRALALPDTEALGAGQAVTVGDVAFEIHHEPAINALLILADIGPVNADDRAAVYEQVLELQVLTWGQSASRFGFNRARDTLLLMLGTSLGADTNGPWLATVLRSMAQQIIEWRQGLLGGRLQAPEVWRDAADRYVAEASQQAQRDGSPA